MLSYPEALDKILKTRARSLGTEVRPLMRSLGGRLAEAVCAGEDLPAADNSAMDGFAVRAELTRQASPQTPVVFEVCGEWVAGAPAQVSDPRPEAVFAIMTGALLPPSLFDAVVKIEDVEVFFEAGKKCIKLFAPLEPGTHVRPRGSDIRQGQEILAAGQRLRSEEIMALAALGVGEVKVFEKIRVAVLSTGREIIAFNQPRTLPEQVRNSSSPYLYSYLSTLDCQVDLYQQTEDSPAEFYKLFQRVVANNYHLILTTGGVSMGNMDFVAGTLADCGVRTEFHKVAIRPGKPVLFGIHESTGTAVFGLPGNPVSTAVGARFFVTPYLQKLRNEKAGRKTTAKASTATTKPAGLGCFFKGRWHSRDEGQNEVEILKGQGSYMLHSLVAADCWVYLPPELERVAQGQCLEVFSLDGMS